MPITILDDATISAQALAFLRNRFPGKDTGTESFLGKIARSFGMMAMTLQKAAADADNDSSPSTKSSTAALDGFAYLFGLSNGSGGFGRKGATAAAGGIADCTGTKGTIYPINAALVGSDGVTLFKLVGSVTIPGIPPGSGSISGSFAATTLGTGGNLPVGSVFTWQSPPSGSDPTITLGTGLSGAIDAESNTALLTRILERLQNVPKGSASADYRAFAEANIGILRAYPYPLRGGLGTVQIVLTGPGTGTSRDPGAAVKTLVDNAINGTSLIPGERLVTVGFTSFRPYFPGGQGLNIRLRMTASQSKYNFDWALGASGLVVAGSGYAAGPPAQITLTANAPASLATAVLNASTNGTPYPRIQVLSAGAVVPVQVRVTAALTSSAVITLENPLPQGFVAPSGGEIVYPGGPMVSSIASAVLAYIDSLGPSRSSGFADPNDLWEDSAAIARMTQLALDQVDADGITHFAKNIVSGGVTIGGAATDYQASDNTINGPQLIVASFVAVTD